MLAKVGKQTWIAFVVCGGCDNAPRSDPLRGLCTPTVFFQGLQPPGIRHFQAAVLGFALEKSGAADAILAANVPGPHPGLLLAQNPDDLLFRKPWPRAALGAGVLQTVEDLKDAIHDFTAD
jgi:hypothetical protein